MTPRLHLRFGIQSLDEMFGGLPDEPGIEVCVKEALTRDSKHNPLRLGDGGGWIATSMCIAGPAGTGKSVLAMHLAAYYRNDFGDGPSIIYASTDFRYEKALQLWQNFELRHPAARASLESHLSRERPLPLLKQCPSIQLESHSASNLDAKLRQYLLRTKKRQSVANAAKLSVTP